VPSTASILKLMPGATLGVVGESGCGKSIMAMSVMRLIPEPPGKIVEGKILLRRKHEDRVVDLAKIDPRGNEMRMIRGGEIAIVFQEPMTSLNPLYTIGDQVSEAITIHQNLSKKDARIKLSKCSPRSRSARPSSAWMNTRTR
jgi:ABC-type dipeptide/oligopeptide/nickel transport system ATPase component